MAAIPSAINLFENHLALSNDDGKLAYSDCAVDPADKEHLIDVDLEQALVTNDKNNNGEEEILWQQYFNQFWPCRLLKILNWLILLALVICTCLSASYHLWWSNYWRTVFSERPYDQADEWATGQCILFALASVSMLGNIFVVKNADDPNKNYWTAFFALMDLCIMALAVPILLITNMLYTLHAIAEFRWFWPKLANFNGSQAELAELTETTTNPNSDTLSRYITEHRQQTIWLHLITDPSISLLTTLAIPLNVALLFLVCRLMRKAHVWSSSIATNNGCCDSSNCNNHSEEQQEQQQQCSPDFDAQYSRHYPYGLLNTAKWLFPLLMLFAFLYVPLFHMHWLSPNFPMILGAISACHFVHWLFYFCAMHFRHQQLPDENATSNNANDKNHRLLRVFLADVILTFCSVFIIISTRDAFQWDRAIHIRLPLLMLYIGSLALCCALGWRTLFGKDLLLNLTLFSTQIKVEVIRKEPKEAGIQQKKYYNNAIAAGINNGPKGMNAAARICE